VRAGNIIAEKPGGQKSGEDPLAADHLPKEVMVACPKIRLPFLQGQTKCMAVAFQLRLLTSSFRWTSQALGSARTLAAMLGRPRGPPKRLVLAGIACKALP